MNVRVVNVSIDLRERKSKKFGADGPKIVLVFHIPIL